MFKEQETKNKDEGFVDEKGKDFQQPEDTKIVEPKNPDDIDLNAKFEYNDNHLKDIEQGRLDFFKMIKKENIIKWVTMAIAVALLLFSFIYLLGQGKEQQNQGMQIAGYCLTALSVVIVIVYYVIIRRLNAKWMQTYLKKYYGDTNAYVFDNPRFSDVNGNIEGKIDNFEFNNSKLYKNVSTIGSRNLVNFKIDHKYECRMVDCAAQMTNIKKLEPLFIGKYLIVPNSYKDDNEIIVYLTGNKRALPPNNVEQLPKVVNTRKMIIYSNNKLYGNYLNKKALEAIEKLVTNNVLVDVSISITKGNTYIGLGYDDCLMVLPLREKFNPLPIERFKSDMNIVADIISSLE